MAEGEKEAVRADEEVFASSEVKALEKRVRELERFLGKRTVENEFLREAVKVAHEKKMDLAFAVVTRRGYPVRRVAEVLEVSRSQLPERLRHGLAPRTRYRKAEDADLLQAVRRLVDERPTYGYRRIGALLDRECEKAGLPRLNHKRFYRLMAQNGMPLQRYTGKPPSPAYDGQGITIRPTFVGRRTDLKLPAPTVRPFGWPLRWILATGKSLPGASVPVGSVAR